MTRYFLAVLSVLVIILLLAFTAYVKPGNAKTSQQKQLTVISHTRGEETVTAELVDNQVNVKLTNNHKDTITAFVLNLSDTTITEDFAYSEVRFGVEPGHTFEKSYPTSMSEGAPPPGVQLLAVLLRGGGVEGNSKVAQEIKDERLGEKIQLLRTLKILEKEGQSHKDLKTTRSEIVAALNATESQTLLTLDELSPNSTIHDHLSDSLKAGLQWGLEKMLRKIDVIEKLPTAKREEGFTEFRLRSQKLVPKL